MESRRSESARRYRRDGERGTRGAAAGHLFQVRGIMVVAALADLSVYGHFAGPSLRNETHLGTEYAVLLVDPSFHPAAILSELPKRGQGIAAVAAARGQEKSSSFFVDFSGFTWRVRWKPSDRGGTSNPYRPENVYTDKVGALHLQIVKRDQGWTCSEVNLTRSLGYGTYSFTVEDISGLEPPVVFGMFTWEYATDRENY